MIHVIWSWLTSAWGWYTPDKITALATIVYAAVTIVMFLAIHSQAKAAHRQADIADVAAKAAKQSADTLINVERPWILVRMEPTGPHRVGKVWWTGTIGQPDSRELTSIEAMTGVHRKPERVELTIKNYGRSPGWVTYSWADAKIVDSVKEFPVTPDYFARRGSIHINTCNDFLEPRRSRKSSIFSTPDDLKPVADGTRFLYVYGIVNYRDVWKGEHYTRFCFFWFIPDDGDITPQGFYAEGPDGYNEET